MAFARATQMIVCSCPSSSPSLLRCSRRRWRGFGSELQSASQIPGFLLDRVATPPSRFAALRGDRPFGHQRPRRDRGCLRRRQARTTASCATERGRITTIDVPGARGTAAQKINNRGQIVGVYSETSPDTQVPARAWLPAGARQVHQDRCPGPCKPGPSASTTAGRWWVTTSTPTAWSTASCGTRAGSPRSTCPEPP